MPGGLRWGLASTALLFTVEAAFTFVVAILQFTLTSDRAPGLLSQLLGGAVVTIVFIGSLRVIAGAGYLWTLWRMIGTRPRFRTWAIALSPLVAAPALFDLSFLIANPGYVAYWLLPAFLFGLVVRPPPARPAATSAV